MKIMIAAGGTGGHVFPGLAVAAVLRSRGHEVVWMGTPDSFEARTVPKHGIEVRFVRVKGLRGKGALSWLGAPLRLLRALRDALAVVRSERPDVLLGMGGFAAGPGGLAAWLTRRPLVIHEQNSIAGLTNKLLARIARRVLEAFPRTFAGAETVGNPVRPGFAELADPAQRLGARGAPGQVLVIGGSLGAKALNEMVPAALALIPAAQRPLVRHQGGRTLEAAQAAYAKHGVSGEVTAFIDDMVAAYGWADLVICRAGASTVAELAAAGCAALLVPYPHAVDDHQTHNGQYLVDAGAALMVPEELLSPDLLAQMLIGLLDRREQLVMMAQAARKAAWPNAVNVIADACIEAAA
ncbi:undecaprenyldiphospho-muramoylpentapeptide beta-N-acetylglucosaminyltransferase [Nevskia soli]|uniref:undecaprenyldiphospho-muramoylpentapeptide beta-N-acetylglucosaminyltransferase n=1 Tax=Nevskia soli TaxID=418856 RepID=UPI0004A7833C|nr:undecaprenyldiphospho-muramoylpentapeptide beta-N-acetylglucosaminyltransferase [Nevskia soli]